MELGSCIPEIRVYSPAEKEVCFDETMNFMGFSTTNSGSGMTSTNLPNNMNQTQDMRSNPDIQRQKLSDFLDDDISYIMSQNEACKSRCETPFFDQFQTLSNISAPTEMVRWENVFNMRAKNLNSFGSTSFSSYRSSYANRAHTVIMNRAKLGFITSTARSLDLLRQTLQKSINREIDSILQKYLEKYFKCSVENIKVNNGDNSVSEQHVQAVCRQILDEAKKMYLGSVHTRGPSPTTEISDQENSLLPDTKQVHHYHRNVNYLKRKESDTDSEASQNLVKPKRKKGRPPLKFGHGSGRLTPSKIKLDLVKREGPKWDPERINSETKFVMGSKANKALGLGATRGRIYIKHPEVFKYAGDQEDKQWLHKYQRMPMTGGKAYLLIAEDIRDLLQTEEYCNNPGILPEELAGFTVPDFFIQKMKLSMQLLKTDSVVHKRRGRPPLNVDSSIQADPKAELQKLNRGDLNSGPGSPVDDLDLLNTEMPSSNPSPFNLGAGFEDVSPVQGNVSPTPSEMSATLEPPLSAPFEICSSQL